jgi:hypothetical protein
LNNRSIIPPISTNQTIPYNFNSLQIQKKKYNDHAINPSSALGEAQQCKEVKLVNGIPTLPS